MVDIWKGLTQQVVSYFAAESVRVEKIPIQCPMRTKANPLLAHHRLKEEPVLYVHFLYYQNSARFKQIIAVFTTSCMDNVRVISI